MPTDFYIFKKKYIKIEDLNGRYRPFFKEYNKEQMPSYKINGAALTCPFKKYEKRVPIRNTNKAKIKLDGFCELCIVKFENYQSHINSQEHMKSARRSKNFKKIDELIENFIDECEEDSDLSLYEMPISPVEQKIPDCFNDPSAYLSYNSNKNKSAISITFDSSTSSPKRTKKIVYNVSDYINDLLDNN